MAYMVLAYPELSALDFDRIQNFRRVSDELFKIVEPHFTIVFPVFDIPKDEIIGEIKENAVHFSKIDFTISSATLHKDEIRNQFNAYLVPDEGYDHIVNLHDKLYSGILKGNLRLDLVYIPHITIGNSLDLLTCKNMVDEWNAKEISIRGTISSLTIINYENDVVTRLEEIELN